MKTTHMKIITGGLLTFTTACLAVPAFAQTSAREYSLEIERQPVADALIEFSRQTGLQFGYFPETPTEKILVGPLSGRYTADAAITQLLLASGLSFERLNERTIAVMGPASTKSQRRGVLGKERKTDQRTAHSFMRLADLRLAEEPATEEVQRTRTAANARESESEDKRKRGVLEEVIVTAQKREERTIDVPMSISAISGEKLTEAGINNAMDLSRVVPSLSVAETGPGRQIISIRGISGFRGSSSLTGVYLDEVPLTGAQDGFVASYADARVLDLERVEVLKGPQGTLFGEGSVGGTIRFITQDPDLSAVGGQVAAKFSDTTDGVMSEEVSGILNVPFVTDVLGIRVAGSYENAAGWIDQPSIGRSNINDSDVKHVRLKALYAPTPQLRIKGLVVRHRNSGGASNIVNQEPLEESNFLQAVDRDIPTGYRDDYDLYNVSIVYSLGFAQLLSSTSYEEFSSVQSFTQMVGTLPTPWLEIVLPAYGHDETITVQELRLTSATNGPFEWTLGGSYKDDELVQSWGPQGFFGNFLGLGLEIRGLFAGLMPTTESESWAVFGDASYKFFDRLEIGGGVRYFSDRRASFDPALPASGRLSGSFSKLTYRSYVKYDLAQDVNAYVNVATGFRSGGFNNPQQVRFGAPATYDPENSTFYEAGTKMSLLGGRIHLNVAAFYGEFEDLLQDVTAPSALSPTGGVQFTANGQSAEIKGFEAEFSWLATNRLTLGIAGDVTDTEITRVDPRAVASPYAVGDPINWIPEYSVSASADYRFQWTQSVTGSLLLSFSRKGEAVSTSRAFGIPGVSPVVMAPPLNFLNASVGAEWSGWKWSVFGTNLLDERGLLFPTESGWSAQARPRTFGVSVHKEF